MPSLDWIGKKAVVKHHLEVPFRLLKGDESLSVGEAGSGNLLVQGDNLLALKALLPYYAGRVKRVYIDPPYNTGNENWVYNDNNNAPEIKKWLGQTVGKESEDLCRHDKWMCMMYPRLVLLRLFLARNGIIAVSIDDNELFHCGLLLDEIFGPGNRLACAPWLAEPSGGKQKTSLRKGHEYLLIYHNGDDSQLTREEKSSGALNERDKFGRYRKGRELLKWGEQSLREDRANMWFPFRNLSQEEVYPYRGDGREGRWRIGKENALTKMILEDPAHAHWELRPFDEGVSVAGKRERWVPYEKIRDVKRNFGWTTWLDSFGFNADATRELKDIFGDKRFDTPKPMQLLRWLISLHSDDDALILDSFAGSGTTAHSVLAQNKADGGSRRFICVEMDEGICQNVTAHRIRKAIEGYGETMGLGGGFRFATLGSPLFDEHGQIAQEVRFADLARHVYFAETGEPQPKATNGKSPLIGLCGRMAYYLLYNGILGDKSVSGGNVLTEKILRPLPAHPLGEGNPRVVFGEGCRLGAARLEREGIVFRQLPYEIKVT